MCRRYVVVALAQSLRVVLELELWRGGVSDHEEVVSSVGLISRLFWWYLIHCGLRLLRDLIALAVDAN